jgi:REP element-mobilizing transposase RayT
MPAPPSVAIAGPPRPQPKLLDRLREALRSRHYSPRTEQTYCHWVKRFIFFHHVRHPAEMGEPEVNAFLTSLAMKGKVSASTQNQALSALLFLYRYVLDRPFVPRGPRLDAPGTLHHVMVRGIERRRLFATTTDRRDFVARLEAVVGATGVRVLAWALLPNHVHLLVRTGHHPLATAMRRLLTGYAVAFNHRHQRHGHLFQNRYKSILVEEEPYLRELSRYIHLNPLRAKVVRDLAALDRYPWTGHSTLVGRVPRRWQAVTEVLGAFGQQVRAARHRYRQFVADGLPQGRRPDLQGGGSGGVPGAGRASPPSAGAARGGPSMNGSSAPGRSSSTSCTACPRPPPGPGPRRRPPSPP